MTTVLIVLACWIGFSVIVLAVFAFATFLPGLVHRIDVWLGGDPEPTGEELCREWDRFVNRLPVSNDRKVA